jgi:putative transposase
LYKKSLFYSFTSRARLGNVCSDMKYGELKNIRGVQRIFRARFKLDQPGLISHITQRAAGKELLFLENNDYLAMLGILKKSAKEYNIRYLALCIMQNHVHILIKTQEKNLFEAMKYIFSRYALWFNKKYQRKGHLFAGPYRQSVCLDSVYLLAASVYIHLNPVRAGLVENASKYRWSSSRLYCKEEPVKSFVDPWPVLELLDHDRIISVRQYELILREGRAAKQENIFEKKGAVERFCGRLGEMFPSMFERIAKKGSVELENNETGLMLDPVEKLTSEFQDIPSTRKPETRIARKYIVEQLLARGFNQTQIAEHLEISRKTVYNILNSKG